MIMSTKLALRSVVIPYAVISVMMVFIICNHLHTSLSASSLSCICSVA